jgi:hypothetical protein
LMPTPEYPARRIRVMAASIIRSRDGAAFIQPP